MEDGRSVDFHDNGEIHVNSPGCSAIVNFVNGKGLVEG